MSKVQLIKCDGYCKNSTEDRQGWFVVGVVKGTRDFVVSRSEYYSVATKSFTEAKEMVYLDICPNCFSQTIKDITNGGWPFNASEQKPVLPPSDPDSEYEWCPSCDGTGVMDGWNKRNGFSCPKCKGAATIKKGNK